jgi:hypothetical protein
MGGKLRSTEITLLGSGPFDEPEREQEVEGNKFQGVQFQLTLDMLRRLGAEIIKGEFTTEQAKAFVLLHGQEFQAKLNSQAKLFIREKLGKLGSL